MIVRSLTEFVTTVDTLATGAQVAWFRGVRSHRYPLVPSLYRLGQPSWATDDYLDLEERLLDRFEERSLPFRTREAPRDKTGFLFEMQHYGAPTRLLDWSENALMALWFALEVENGRRARVWALDAALWNRCVYPGRGDVNNVVSATHDVVRGLLPWVTLKRSQLVQRPLCIFGVHNNTRIVGQRGVFTLSGLSRAPMESQAATLAASSGVSVSKLLVPIDIPLQAKAPVRDALARIGFSRSMVFPDLGGLAEELKERAQAGTL